MGRRMRNVAGDRFEDGSRSSIGDFYVETACESLRKACIKEASLFTEAFTARDVVPMLFRDGDVDCLTAAHGLLWYENVSGSYDLAPYAHGSLWITTDWMPAPNKAIMHWQPERAGPLAKAVQVLNELHVKWGAVQHLLRWFNRHATIGAVRANWPAVLTLCPNAPSLKELQHAPQRYTNPQELSAMLPLIRATASTVATMALLPGDAQVAPRTAGTVRYTASERSVDYQGVKVSLNTQSFFL